MNLLMPDDGDNKRLLRPPWLQEQPGIESLLHLVVTRLDRRPGTVPGFTLNKKILPELFNQGEEADLTWTLLQTLFDEAGTIFSFCENKKRNYNDPVYANARIKFIAQAEELLRCWLNRPVEDSETQLWKNSVEEYKSRFPGDVSRLMASKISVPGKTTENIIHGFIAVNKYMGDELTLRNLSARCFWEDSKFLDNREDFLRQLYPQLKIKTRPVLVSVYLPENIEGILFIENQDSYTQAMISISGAFSNLALVYSAGFKLSAKRIRHPEGVSLHFHGESRPVLLNRFINWWYDDNDGGWPVYFWGDLDYAGINILANLKRRFGAIQAWQTGYQPMLEHLLNGAGHPPEATGKQGQRDVGETGCVYADGILIPALRQSGRFIDQEWVFE